MVKFFFKNKTRSFLTVLVLVVIAVLVYVFFLKPKPVAPRESVHTGDVVETVSLTGTLEPIKYADLSFTGAGRVQAIYAHEGDAVKKGQLIMVLDTPVQQAQLSEAQVNTAYAVQQEELQRRQWDNLKPEERTAAKLATELLRKKELTAQAQFSSDQIRAPFDGIITHLDAKIGETLTTGTVVARITDPSLGLIAKADVSESDVAKLREGVSANFTFDALSRDDILKGQLIHIDSTATVNQDVVSYETDFTLLSSDARLRDGMTVDVDVTTNEKHGVLVLPLRSIQRDEQGNFVDRYKPDGTTEQVRIVTGLEGDDGTVEVARGLAEGDQVTLGAGQTQ